MAQQVAQQVASTLESLDYQIAAAKAKRGEVEVREERLGTVRLQVEIQYLFDSGNAGPVRVLVSVDDGGIQALAPATSDTIIKPR